MKSKEGKATEELKNLFEYVKSRNTNPPGVTDHLSSPPRSSTIFHPLKKMRMKMKILKPPSRKRLATWQ